MDWKKKTHTLNTTVLVLLITMVVLNSTHTHFAFLPATSPSPAVPQIFYQLLAVLLIAAMFLLMFWIIYYMPLYIEFS
ncbi:MAG: hypothetical protein JHC26_08635 [Thermofilum sp.]|jgi:uncharacterized integral membrane protein|uniref:hypothetical protein n=1 Tax=Thermofilum sp. TaxID=1961369 RepID=UPI00258FECF7|nr:hypothetical protein [Thermofilum sp.]MCI4409143.1 hypothetical protein [Thermofilum sp.]